MRLSLQPTKLRGRITPPPSKSIAHRMLIASALAGGGTVLGLAESQDIVATRRCMEALLDRSAPLPRLDCGESGSTLRFLIPIALALRGGGRLTGQGRLMERPLAPYRDLFIPRGVEWVQENGLLTVRGTLRAGAFTLPGNVSSQFVTGLLFALPLLEGDSEIVLTSELESRGYVELTVDALRAFGVTAEERDARRLRVPGGQRYRPADVTVESDYSQAAFFFVAAALGNDVTVEGLSPHSLQGDRAIVDFCRAMAGPGDLDLNVSQQPDLVPPMALCACLRDGFTTRISGAARLRMKESDRLDTVAAQLAALGADIVQTEDSLIIRGVPALRGGAVSGCGDHRIAMMLGIAATRADGPVVLEGAECVAKSYPSFWADYAALGGQWKEE